MSLAVIILTYNEEAHIQAAIESARWADEVLVLDSFSTDATAQLAEAHGARLARHPFENYGAQRNAALDRVDTDWVFFLDADERIPPALAAEINGCLGKGEAGWWVPRHNYIFGKLTRWAGWYPDYQLRLMRRTQARYDPGRPVHEEVLLQGGAGHLANPLIHYNYHSVSQFHQKQHKYARYEAQIRFNAGQRVKPTSYLSMPVRQFLWRFVTLKGYRDGLHGLRLSLLMAYYEYVTWRYVAELSSSA